LHRSWWKNFEVRVGMSKLFGGCWKLKKIKLTPAQLSGIRWAEEHELHVLQRTWSCWWLYVQSGRCTTHTSVSSFKEYWNSPVSVSRIMHNKPHTQRKTMCLYGWWCHLCIKMNQNDLFAKKWRLNIHIHCECGCLQSCIVWSLMFVEEHLAKD